MTPPMTWGGALLQVAAQIDGIVAPVDIDLSQNLRATGFTELWRVFHRSFSDFFFEAAYVVPLTHHRCPHLLQLSSAAALGNSCLTACRSTRNFPLRCRRYRPLGGGYAGLLGALGWTYILHTDSR